LIDEEVNGMDRDFECIKSDPKSRFDRLIDHVSSNESFAKRFWYGNEETLLNKEEGLKKALSDFYKQYYSANQMFAVVYGPNKIKELLDLSVRIYSGIPNRKAPNLSYVDRPLPYSRDFNMQQVIKVKPLHNVHNLTVFFPLPYCKQDDSSHIKYIEA